MPDLGTPPPSPREKVEKSGGTWGRGMKTELGKSGARGSSVRTAGRTTGPDGPPNGPDGPPNGPDGGAGDRRLRPWYLTRGWIMSHLYIQFGIDTVRV